jgi:hypothetical protein
MFLVNGELQNADPALKPAMLPAALLSDDTPQTGRLQFNCADARHLGAVMRCLTARRASALMGLDAGRIYLRAIGTVDRTGPFPRRVTIAVEIIDDPGPAER